MFKAVALVAGSASGAPLRLDEPLSFWGGLEPATGLIVDRWHPQRQANVAGRVLMMPAGRGSSSGSAALAEAIRLGAGRRRSCCLSGTPSSSSARWSQPSFTASNAQSRWRTPATGIGSPRRPG